MSEFRFVSGGEYLELPCEAETWVVEPLLSPGALLNIYGAPKAGKSRLALGLALAVANGDELWLGRYPIRLGGPVLWLEADNSPAEWREVVRTVAHGDGHDIRNIHFADRKLIPYPFDLRDPDHQAVLKAMVDAFEQEWGCRPVLIVIDTIREVHSGEENDSTNMRNVIVALQAATDPAALCLVSHSRKGSGLSTSGKMLTPESEEGASASVMDGNRGSNYLTGKMQSVIRVTTTRNRSHGFFTAEGRSIGQERFKMRQVPNGFLWVPDEDPVAAFIHAARKDHPDWSGRRIAREVDTVFKMGDEKAWSTVRRTLGKAVK